jgi:hypothetical protein
MLLNRWKQLIGGAVTVFYFTRLCRRVPSRTLPSLLLSLSSLLHVASSKLPIILALSTSPSEILLASATVLLHVY